MEEDGQELMSRPKRRRTRRGVTATQPSAVHYVGYVEDDETPEMIMAKFEALERIQSSVPKQEDGDGLKDSSTALDLMTQADQNSRDGCLTDGQLLEVFKQTSMFNVRTALGDNGILLSIDELLSHSTDRCLSDDEVSDEEDWLRNFWSTEDGESGRQKESKSSRSRTQELGIQSAPSRHKVVTTYNPFSQTLVRRRVRISDKTDVVTIRVPGPDLPLSWGRTVAPYRPPDTLLPASELPLLSDWVHSRDRSECYEAALVNPGWIFYENPIQAFSSVPLPDLVPYGFVFIFVPKEFIQDVCGQMSVWGLSYIENLTWVHLAPNHTVDRARGRFFCTSHTSLYMFRWTERGRDTELRHQRNPDVVLDCCLASLGSGLYRTPIPVYETIETMLPAAKDKLLELWAEPTAESRPGWTSVAFQR